jgi:biopolymer transport protein ExbB
MMRTVAAPQRFARLARGLVLLAGLLACAAHAEGWWNPDWSYRKQLTLTAPADPAAPAGVPVLIRLHDGVVDFAQVAPDGADLRFVAGDDKTPLAFQVEKFDAVFNLGFVWVQVPGLAPGQPTTIWMYWGNAKATAGGEPARTWDGDQALVWHFGERGAPATDSTAWRNNAGGLVAVEDAGLIGSAARFDGQGTVSVPSGQALTLAAGGSQTISMWIKPAADAADAVLYARRDATGSVVIGLAQGAPYVGITGVDGVEIRSTPGAALPAGGWHHLALVLAEQATLYVDGVPAPGVVAGAPALGTPASLGGEGGIEGVPVTVGFAGEIDEFRIAKTALAASRIAFEAANQGTADSTLQFGPDEVQSSWSSGYVGIILASLTFDGWVAIGVLVVMMLISWYVMAVKARQIGRVAKANKVFMRVFRAAGSDFANMADLAHGGGLKLPPREAALLEQSPLLHVYRTGVDELKLRMTSERRSDVLSSQSLAAIRASIDASIVHESLQLNSQLVLLTIAISGGPFIGLLGTVIGVMITFAGVAAAGDVNINAIAPGISAALAATVAGLFVAIPALFGYNYLVTRVKETAAEMQVFVDAFISRMAESYNDPSALRAMG